MNTIRPLCLMLLVLLLWAGRPAAPEVNMEGDGPTVHADRLPLQAVPARVPDLGVRARIDAETDPAMSASFRDRDLQKGPASIEEVLSSFQPKECAPSARQSRLYNNIGKMKLFQYIISIN